MGVFLIVPVRGDAGGSLTLHTGRLDQGPTRVGIAFTDVARLRTALGETHRWIRLAEPALRSMLRPMGITRIQVDPVLVGPRGEVTVCAYAGEIAETRAPRWRPSSTAKN